jgi:hypothetical protein
MVPSGSAPQELSNECHVHMLRQSPTFLGQFLCPALGAEETISYKDLGKKKIIKIS